MLIDRMIGAFARHLNRRMLSFEPAPDGLPAPPSIAPRLLYLHVPFCMTLCPFCSFHRVLFGEERASAYFKALQAEIGAATALGYRFSEIYVGGGTPTVLPEALAETIEKVTGQHPVTAVSVETNPHDLDPATLDRLKNAGVNRLSVGVQSFDDGLLAAMQRLDRYGSGDEIAAHLRQVSGIFDTLNVDMIFNFPRQDEAMLDRDLERLVDELGVDQVSWYPLMTTDATSRPLAQALGVVDYGRERSLYQRISRRMLGAGYLRSSAWCFSKRPGMFDEYIVEHDEYVGLGSGAFSYLGGRMYANTFSINHYLRAVEAGGTSATGVRALTRLEQMRYFLLMKLFSGTLRKADAVQRFGEEWRAGMYRDIAGLRLVGAVDENAAELRLTEYGYYIWGVLMREFFSGINGFRDEMRRRIPDEGVPRRANFG